MKTNNAEYRRPGQPLERLVPVPFEVRPPVTTHREPLAGVVRATRRVISISVR